MSQRDAETTSIFKTVKSRVTPAVSLILLTTLVGILLLPRLPAEMAIHFTAGGSPNRYVSKLIGIVIVPAAMALALVAVRLAYQADPPTNPEIIPVMTNGILGMLSVTHVAVLLWNLGYQVSITALTVGIVVGSVGLSVYPVVRERSSAPN